MENKKNIPGAPAAEAAVKVTELLGSSDEALSLSQISRELGMNKNMISRVLGILEKEGWVYCDDFSSGKYALTLRPFVMTGKARDRIKLNTVALPYVYRLWQQTGDSTFLGVLKQDRVLYLQHLDSTKDIKIAGSAGGSYPLYCSAPGKVLLAYADEETLRRTVAEGMPARTANTITDAPSLRAELERIRESGYAVDREEFGNGISCCAAPIFDCSGAVLGSIGCSSYTVNGRVDETLSDIIPAVISAARDISAIFGYGKAEEDI